MKEFTVIAVLMGVFTFSLVETGVWDNLQERAEVVHNYEYKSLSLAKQLRHLKRENQELQAKIAVLESQKEHLAMSLQNRKRTIASIPKKKVNDLVNFELYKWTPEKLLGVGEKALHFKKYDKSAQYYNTLMEKYPEHKSINDNTLFEAGIAAYESKKHYDWAVNHFNALIRKYPNSKLYRGAKLWLGLSHFHKGDHEKFMQTVEEFRSKYRNTQEWKVLSKYYEDLAYKYKRQN